VHGNSERILQRDRSNIAYPVLWLETPDINPRDVAGLRHDYQGTILVLTNAQAGDWDKEDEQLDKMLIIVNDLLQKMYEDYEAGTLQEFRVNGAIEHKGRWGTDNDWGWRFSFTISVQVDCLDETKFA